MNQITINFNECDPAPENGYNIQWRVLGSGDPYTDAGNFFSSPAVFNDEVNPPGTCYEGIIQSDCSPSGESGTVLGEPVGWQSNCIESGLQNSEVFYNIIDNSHSQTVIRRNEINQVTTETTASGSFMVLPGGAVRIIQRLPDFGYANYVIVSDLTTAAEIYNSGITTDAVDTSFFVADGHNYLISVTVVVS